MAKKAEPISSIMIDGEEYFTVPVLANKYNVHLKRIHNCMSRLKIPRKQLGTMILIKDDPRFDPNYQKPANPGSFKKGEDGRRQHIVGYMELNRNIKDLIDKVDTLYSMVNTIYLRVNQPEEFDTVHGDDQP